MWGPTIVGFDSYHYRYESGRDGDIAIVGFSPRKNDLSIYLVAEAPDEAQLLARLGRHKMGKSCLSIRRLSDVDAGVLEELVAGAVAEARSPRMHAAAIPRETPGQVPHPARDPVPDTPHAPVPDTPHDPEPDQPHDPVPGRPADPTAPPLPQRDPGQPVPQRVG